MAKGNFYIGWEKEMPAAQRRFLQRIIWIVLPLLIVLSVAVVWWQRPFNNHVFEFGKLTEVTGHYFSKPYPMLVAHEGQLPAELSDNILLVGYGKFGAEGIMSQIAEKLQGQTDFLDGKEMTLAGSLIYGDGKTVLELTEQADAFRSLGTAPEKASSANVASQAQVVNLTGEIIDPKCYFGVMKPGEGKVHKSCAIRCISGGIPPVYRHGEGTADAPYQYYLLQDKEGRPVREAILSLVGEDIALTGQTGRANGWDVLYVNPEELPQQ